MWYPVCVVCDSMWCGMTLWHSNDGMDTSKSQWANRKKEKSRVNEKKLLLNEKLIDKKKWNKKNGKRCVNKLDR